MFDEKQLENLQSIKVSDDKKQADFEQMEQRLNKKPFHWQVPAVAFSMVLLLLFLVATMPVYDKTVHLSSDAYLTSILERDGKGDPKSIYYLGVSRTTDKEDLQVMQTILDTLQPIDKPSVKPKVFKSYRFTYSDGSDFVLYEYLAGNKVYYEDAATGNYYQVQEGSDIIPIKQTRSEPWQYALFGLLFFLLFGGNLYIDKKMRVDGDKKRKLPMHSHYTQSIVTIGFVFVLFLLFVGGMNGNAHIHIGGIYVVSFVMMAVNIFIEQQNDNNGWRKLRFVNVSLMFPTYLYLLVQLQ